MYDLQEKEVRRTLSPHRIGWLFVVKERHNQAESWRDCAQRRQIESATAASMALSNAKQ